MRRAAIKGPARELIEITTLCPGTVSAPILYRSDGGVWLTQVVMILLLVFSYVPIIF